MGGFGTTRREEKKWRGNDKKVWQPASCRRAKRTNTTRGIARTIVKKAIKEASFHGKDVKSDDVAGRGGLEGKSMGALADQR